MAFVTMHRRDNVENDRYNRRSQESSSTHHIYHKQQLQPVQRQREPILRSSSIKIPNEPNAEVSIKDEDISLMEEHYNYATLRMYYRIIDYRNRNPVPSTYDDVTAMPSTTTATNEHTAIDYNTHNVYANERELPAANPNANFIAEEDDDAIFDLDL